MSFVGVGAVTAKKVNQVPQGGRRKEDRRPVIRRRTGLRLRHRQIGPVPRYGGHAPDTKSH